MKKNALCGCVHLCKILAQRFQCISHWTYMYICMYVCTYTHTFQVHTYIHIQALTLLFSFLSPMRQHAHTCIHAYIHIQALALICSFSCLSESDVLTVTSALNPVGECVYRTCAYVYVCVCMCVCMYMNADCHICT